MRKETQKTKGKKENTMEPSERGMKMGELGRKAGSGAALSLGMVAAGYIRTGHLRENLKKVKEEDKRDCPLWLCPGRKNKHEWGD